MVRRALEEGRTVSLVAMGSSMLPTIVPGTLVTLTPDPARRAQPGEIVAVGRPDGGIAIHRVVHVLDDQRVITWGDALGAPDAWGPAAVLAWAQGVQLPWRPGAWRRWWGALRGQWHVTRGRWWAP